MCESGVFFCCHCKNKTKQTNKPRSAPAGYLWRGVGARQGEVDEDVEDIPDDADEQSREFKEEDEEGRRSARKRLQRLGEAPHCLETRTSASLF